jgi:Leucine-rich repeat (LRR) protein
MLPLVPLVCLTGHALRVVRHASVKLLTILFAALTMSSVSYAVIPDTERAVLLALFTSTNGDAWTNKTNWNGAPGTECTWFGVTCNADQSHVTGISLQANALSGTLPTTLNQLPALIGIDFLDNFITGSIPALSGLVDLQVFRGQNNQFGGAIPALAGLSALRQFTVNNNQLSGSIPSLTGLTELREFEAKFNQLTGSIPNLAGLTNLEIFDTASNQLTGPIPALAGLTQLARFNVSANQMSGAIPELFALPSLVEFRVNNNQLTGSIPSFAALTAAFGVFDASTNQLTGAIPPLAEPTVFLSVFDVGNNELTGTIPALTGLNDLERFIVSNNGLTGSIPALTGLISLDSFRVDHNHLTGSIPALTELTSLRDFNASANQLSGAITSLSGLTNLNFFDVSKNRVTGSIPTLSGLTVLLIFDVSANQLTGSIPSLDGLAALQRLAIDDNQLSGALPVVPSPSSLLAEFSRLCPNQLTVSPDADWDAATPGTTWDVDCTAALPQQVLSFGAVPTLVVGGTGTVVATVSPSPGSTAPIVYSSLTPSVCSVAAASGVVTALPAAIVGDLCTIAADKANDATINSAVQVQQSIVIQAVVATFTVSPGTVDANGTIDPNTPQTVASGSAATFTITPNAGFNLADVGGTCGGALTGNSFTTNAITADCTVIASFALIPVAAGEVAIPTLSEWMLMLLAIALVVIVALNLGASALAVRRARRVNGRVW